MGQHCSYKVKPLFIWSLSSGRSVVGTSIVIRVCAHCQLATIYIRCPCPLSSFFTLILSSLLNFRNRQPTQQKLRVSNSRTHYRTHTNMNMTFLQSLITGCANTPMHKICQAFDGKMPGIPTTVDSNDPEPTGISRTWFTFFVMMVVLSRQVERIWLRSRASDSRCAKVTWILSDLIMGALCMLVWFSKL